MLLFVSKLLGIPNLSTCYGILKMIEMPKYMELKFYNIMFGNITMEEFESWVYKDVDLPVILSDENYLELISLNYNRNGAKYDLFNFLSSKVIDLGKYERWKLLNLLRQALKRDDNLASILREFYDLYCSGYNFLDVLGLEYGLSVECPPYNDYEVDTWEEMKEKDKKILLDSFYPRLEQEIRKVIKWIEDGKIIFTGQVDDIGNYSYKDLRMNK